VVFGVRLPRALTAAVISKALRTSEANTGLSVAMRGLFAARAAVLAAVTAIDANIRQLVRATAAFRRLVSNDHPRCRLAHRTCLHGRNWRSQPLQGLRDIGAYLGLVPRRYQSGEVNYTSSISKCGDRRVCTLLYEAANVMLTRYKPTLKLTDWAWAELCSYCNLPL
jgi:hypothetical protein